MIQMKLKLVTNSFTLWMEYVGFQFYAVDRFTSEVEKPKSQANVLEWFKRDLEHIHEHAKLVVHHSFIYPPKEEWLNWQTPIINQSVLMATAVPPVTLDLSTDAKQPWRFPIQNAVFPQFRDNISVQMKQYGTKHHRIVTQPDARQ